APLSRYDDPAMRMNAILLQLSILRSKRDGESRRRTIEGNEHDARHTLCLAENRQAAAGATARGTAAATPSTRLHPLVAGVRTMTTRKRTGARPARSDL